MGGIFGPCSHPHSCCQNQKYWLHQQAMSSYCKISSTNLITTVKIWTRSEKSETNYMNTLVYQQLRSTKTTGKVLQTFKSARSDGTGTVHGRSHPNLQMYVQRLLLQCSYTVPVGPRRTTIPSTCTEYSTCICAVLVYTEYAYTLSTGTQYAVELLCIPVP